MTRHLEAFGPAVQTARERISHDRVTDLLELLVRTRSPAGEEGRLAEIIGDVLARTDADIHLQEVVPGRANIIARYGVTGARPQLVLNGHLDTGVAAGWNRDPYEPLLMDGRVYGAGVTDMKAGLAAMLAAFEAGCGLDLGVGELVFIGAMGHNPIGLGTKYAMATEGPWSGYAIFGQSSSLSSHTANGGSIKFEISLVGRTAHISQAEQAIDAWEPASRIASALPGFALTHSPDPRLPDLPRLVVGEIHAGTGPARVPGGAVLRGDIRTVPGMTRLSVQNDLSRVVEQNCPRNVGAKVRITHVQSPFIAPQTGRLVEALSIAHEAITGEALRHLQGLPTEAFITDAVDMQEAGLDTLMYGPATWQSAPDEWVDVEELAAAAQVYLALALLLK